jgi:hypothetical protein
MNTYKTHKLLLFQFPSQIKPIWTCNLTYLDFALPFLVKIKNTCLNVTKFIVLIKEYLKFLTGYTI